MLKKSKNHLSKIEYFGGIEKLKGLRKSYDKYMFEKINMLNSDRNPLNKQSDLTINGISLAIIKSVFKVGETGYIEVIINENEYTLKLSKSEFDTMLILLFGNTQINNETLKVFSGQPYFMTVENGYAKNLSVIDLKKYREAIILLDDKEEE